MLIYFPFSSSHSLPSLHSKQPVALVSRDQLTFLAVLSAPAGETLAGAGNFVPVSIRLTCPVHTLVRLLADIALGAFPAVLAPESQRDKYLSDLHLCLSPCLELSLLFLTPLPSSFYPCAPLFRLLEQTPMSWSHTRCANKTKYSLRLPFPRPL